MNFIFISPNFPHTYWHFCDCLKRNGVNVLGIGDCPYDDLANELKGALTEYYKVDSMENYDSMYRAYHVYGIRRMTVVTQKYHIYRAMYLASSFGIDVDGYVAEDVRYTDQTSRDIREVFARDKDFLSALFKPKVDSPMDPISLNEDGDMTNVRNEMAEEQ